MEQTHRLNNFRQWDRLASFASKLLVWVLLFAAIYMLRSFFLLIFLTFVFAYVQASGARRLEPFIKNRMVRVVISAVILLSLIVATGAFLFPRVKDQTNLFVSRFPAYIESSDAALFDLSARYPMIREVVPVLTEDKTAPKQTENHSAEDSLATHHFDFRRSPTLSFLQTLFGFGEGESASQGLTSSLETAQKIASNLLGLASAFLLSLLFSFLIVLDLPSLAAGAQRLRRTRVGFIYDEVAPSIQMFGQVLGRALEAQLAIAFLNTLLTAAGLVLLGLQEKAAFISVIVFFCSFIPVAGVFISSAPICLLALQDGGVGNMFLAVILITVIHLIEAYILNPKIYGHHLRMNPVLVLIILTIGGKLFHVWGLILGVPICNYIFGYAIQGDHGHDKKRVAQESA